MTWQVWVIESIFLVFAMSLLTWTVVSVISEIGGAVYVPTSRKFMDEMWKLITLAKGKLFMDLGSGDGRVVMAAVEKFGVRGVGVELNPWLTVYAKLRAKLLKINNIKFIQGNYWNTNFTDADYIYCYIKPRIMEKLSIKMEKEMKKKSFVISKAFEIKRWKNKLIKRLEIENRVVYIYEV